MVALPAEDHDAVWKWLRESRVDDDAWQLLRALIVRPAYKDAAVPY
jgi:hypothetical protein